MSLELPLYLYHNLNQAPGVALNAVTPYIPSGYLKRKTAHFLKIGEKQLQNTINVVYPILKHPRRATFSAILFSTKYVANLTGMTGFYQKICYALSGRSEKMTFVENQLLGKLKNLSNYCKQLKIRTIPWQKIPELQTLEALKEELVKSQFLDIPDTITKAISCCDEIHALVTLHHSLSVKDLNLKEMRTIEENAAMDTIFSAIEENTGEALGSYIPSLLAPILNDVLNAIPESFNPFALASRSLIALLKKILVATCSFSILILISNHVQRMLLQICAVSSGIALCFLEEPIEEFAKEILRTFFEIICAYMGMLLFKTDESFEDYFHKIVPAMIASRSTEYFLDCIESSTITSFTYPFIVSSLVYNQASIQESYQRFKTLAIHVLRGEAKRQLLQVMSFFIINQVIIRSSNELSRLVLTRTIKQISYLDLLMSPYVNNQSNILAPLFLPVINQILAQPVKQQALQALNFSLDKFLVEYLTILQQDNMQELILRIRQKFHKLDPEVEELKDQFLKEVLLKKIGRLSPLNNFILDLSKNLFGTDIQTRLFMSFKNTPSTIQVLWNGYSYHKKVDQTLTLELLLQGFIVTALADLVSKSNIAELPSFSYVKTAHLGMSLVL